MRTESMTSLPLPPFYVGKDLTTQRINNFLLYKHPKLTQELGRPDTMSIWYSKEHIEMLLDEINHAGGDGIRISFGMYEASHEFAGQLCLLMNSTRPVARGNGLGHTTVVLENEPDFGERSSRGIRDFNFGSPCPPRCDEELPGGGEG